MTSYRFTDAELTVLSMTANYLAESNEALPEAAKMAVEKAKSSEDGLSLTPAEREALLSIVQTVGSMVEEGTDDLNIDSAALDSLLQKLQA